MKTSIYLSLAVIGLFFSLTNFSAQETLYAPLSLDDAVHRALESNFGIPTNDAFVHRAFAIANKMTDKPFDRADFLLLVGLAERAVMLQEQFGDDIVNQGDESASEEHMDRSRSRFLSRTLAVATSKLKVHAP